MATMNRGNLIEDTIESIVSQATEDVELIILDGSNDSDTARVVKNYQKRFINIRYFHQKPMGVDRDFSNTVDLATGKYCWLFPDDDILKPGAIKTVLYELRKPYALIIVNGQVGNADLSEIIETQRLKIKKNEIFKPENRDELLTTIGPYATYIGCVIIKRELWIERKKEEYVGTEFIHIGVIFQSPLPDDALLISEPLIFLRYGNATWSSRAFEIWMIKWPNLIWSFVGISEFAKQKVCMKNPWQRINNLVTLRAKGFYSLKEYRKWIKPRSRSAKNRFAARFIAQFPGLLVNSFAIIYTLLFYPDAKNLLLDLKNSKFYFMNNCPWVPPLPGRVSR